MMTTGSLQTKEIKTCWVIEKFFEFKNEKTLRSPEFLVNEKKWRCILADELRNTDAISIGIYKGTEKTLADGYQVNININKIDGTSYLDTNTIIRGHYYVGCEQLFKTNLLATKNQLTKDGSLSILITIKSVSSDVISCEQNLNTKEISSQTDLSEAVETLSKDLKELLVDGRHSDVKIKVEDKEFHVHKCVLSARSPVLDSMFSQQMLENINGVVEISDCDANTLNDFLTYLYSGQIEQIPSCRVVELYKIADKYNQPELQKECVKRMTTEMSVASVCDALRIATLYEEKNLMDIAKNFFTDNVEDILTTPDWDVFLEDHPKIGNELFLQSFKSLKKSKTGK